MPWLLPLLLVIMSIRATAAHAAPSPREQLERLLSGIDRPIEREALLGVSLDAAHLLVDIARDPAAHAYVRQRAIQGLASFCTPQVLAELTRLLRDSETEVRQTAAFVLGRHFGRDMPDEVFLALSPVLADPNVGVRRQAARALSFVPRREVVPALNQRLSFETDPQLREFIFNRARQLAVAMAN